MSTRCASAKWQEMHVWKTFSHKHLFFNLKHILWFYSWNWCFIGTWTTHIFGRRRWKRQLWDSLRGYNQHMVTSQRAYFQNILLWCTHFMQNWWRKTDWYWQADKLCEKSKFFFEWSVLIDWFRFKLLTMNTPLTSQLTFLTVVWISFFHIAPVGFPPHWFVFSLLGLLQVAGVASILLHPLIVWGVNLLIRHWTQGRYLPAEDRWCKEPFPVSHAYSQ